MYILAVIANAGPDPWSWFWLIPFAVAIVIVFIARRGGRIDERQRLLTVPPYHHLATLKQIMARESADVWTAAKFRDIRLFMKLNSKDMSSEAIEYLWGLFSSLPSLSCCGVKRAQIEEVLCDICKLAEQGKWQIDSLTIYYMASGNSRLPKNLQYSAASALVDSLLHPRDFDRMRPGIRAYLTDISMSRSMSVDAAPWLIKYINAWDRLWRQVVDATPQDDFPIFEPDALAICINHGFLSRNVELAVAINNHINLWMDEDDKQKYLQQVSDAINDELGYWGLIAQLVRAALSNPYPENVNRSESVDDTQLGSAMEEVPKQPAEPNSGLPSNLNPAMQT
jgi:hypothetical protein